MSYFPLQTPRLKSIVFIFDMICPFFPYLSVYTGKIFQQICFIPFFPSLEPILLISNCFVQDVKNIFSAYLIGFWCGLFFYNLLQSLGTLFQPEVSRIKTPLRLLHLPKSVRIM
jgi:hypothetical protein